MKIKATPKGLIRRGDTWWVDVSHEGRRIRETTGTGDLTEASVALMRVRLALADGTHTSVISAKGSSRPYSVAMAFDRAIAGTWLIGASEGSVRVARSNLQRLHKDGYLTHSTPISTLDAQRLAQLQRDLLDSGLTPATVNNRMWVVRALVEQAERDGIVKVLPKFPAKLATKGNSRHRFLSVDDQARMLTHLVASGHRDLADMWTIVLGTGLRHNEAARLNSTYCDLGRGTITIPEQWSKNGKARVVPMLPVVREVIARRLELSDRVFPIPEGGAPRYWVSKFTREWDAVRGDLGMSDVVMHTGRHTVATRLFQVGSDLRTVMDWMGHSNPSVTLEYAKGTAEATRSAVERLTRLTEGS